MTRAWTRVDWLMFASRSHDAQAVNLLSPNCGRGLGSNQCSNSRRTVDLDRAASCSSALFELPEAGCTADAVVFDLRYDALVLLQTLTFTLVA